MQVIVFPFVLFQMRFVWNLAFVTKKNEIAHIAMLHCLFRRSSCQIAYKALKAEGTRGLYRGLPGIWTKEIPGSFIYFGSFELAKSVLRHFNESPQLSKSLCYVRRVLL